MPTLAAAALQILALLVVLAAVYRPFGDYMARTLTAERHTRVERGIYRVIGVDGDADQRWPVYLRSVVAFSFVSMVVLYAILRLQAFLPYSLGREGMPSLQALNTAISFVTNTNWQSYSGEAALGYTAQMAGLAVQNFLSSAVGIAVAIALVRGFARTRTDRLGNFWVDLTRITLRILLPVAVVFAVVLVFSGVMQNFAGDTAVTTLSGGSQTIPGGPVASQEAIKELGTNGGGFLNANSIHPFENPNGLTNFLQIVLLLLIPFALAFAFGRMAKDRKQGYVVAATMFVLLFGLAANNVYQETHGNSRLTEVGVSQAATAENPGGNFEGKDVRIGSAGCGEFSAATTNTSTGAVNCQHDSMTPLGGGGALFGMMLGEISPGGVGSGLYGMLVFVLMAVFLAGLMVGRTPEYLGKRIQATEIKLVVLYILFVPLVVLGFGAVSVVIGSGLEGQLNSGAHGLSEILYAFTSAGNNNGSAFGGLTVTNDWYTTTLGLCMLIGRFFLIVPALAIAGSLVRKRRVPVTSGTFPTNTPLFAGLLTVTVLIVVGLTYFPMLALGPIVEHLAL